jgi:riboflavin synthase
MLHLEMGLVKDFHHASRYPNCALVEPVVQPFRGTNRGKIFMFTGIIEHLGTIDSLKFDASGGRLTIHSPSVAPHLAIANSIAVDGCCLTVVALDDERFSANLSKETIQKTSMGEWKRGTRVNLEQPMAAGKEFGGHFVLGHVDTIGRVARLDAEGENWWYGIEVPESFAKNIVPQGSIAIDGISLTVARWNGRFTETAIIPFTYEHTNIQSKKIGDAVNLEGDILGKYVNRYLEARSGATAVSNLTIEQLVSQGF